MRTHPLTSDRDFDTLRYCGRRGDRVSELLHTLPMPLNRFLHQLACLKPCLSQYRRLGLWMIQVLGWMACDRYHPALGRMSIVPMIASGADQQPAFSLHCFDHIRIFIPCSTHSRRPKARSTCSGSLRFLANKGSFIKSTNGASASKRFTTSERSFGVEAKLGSSRVS